MNRNIELEAIDVDIQQTSEIQDDTISQSVVPINRHSNTIPTEVKNKEIINRFKSKYNLLFNPKKFYLFKLFYKSFGPFEFVLFFLGLIGNIFIGITESFLTLLISQTITHFNDLNNSNKTDIEESINKKINNIFYAGIIIFGSGFIAHFTLKYVEINQILYIKKNYFNLILNQKQQWFDSINVYEFALKVQAQLTQIELGLGNNYGKIFRCIGQLITGIVLYFIGNWLIAIVLLLYLILFSLLLILYWYNGHKDQKMIREINKVEGIAREILFNIKSIASFANFNYEKKRFNDSINKVLDCEENLAYKFGIFMSCLFVLFFFEFPLVFIIAKKFIENGIEKKLYYIKLNNKDISKIENCIIGPLGIFMLLKTMYLLKQNFIDYWSVRNSSSDYNRLSKKDLNNLETSGEKLKIKNFQGKIEFKNVSLSSHSKEGNTIILKQLNSQFENGKKYVLVGEKESVTKAIINLIEKLYMPDKGEILIDNVNINEYGLKYLHSLIGYVESEPVLFNKSIEENIIFGREELVNKIGNSKQLMDDACKDARVNEFINQNREKYKFVIGINGNKLPPRERVKIAIARAILCKPKILIFDKVTSKLDYNSEMEVQNVIDNISTENITTIIIPNRLCTIKKRDYIYIFKDGELIDQGFHEELLNQNKYYSFLVTKSINEEEFEKKETNIQPFTLRYNNSINKITLDFKKRLFYLNKHKDEINSQSNLKEIITETKRIFKFLSDYKYSLITLGISSFITGVLTIIQAFFIGLALNQLSEKYPKDIKENGFFWIMLCFLVIICNGIAIFLKNWKLRELNSILSTKIKQQVLNKYLQLHMGYFDINENTPSLLLKNVNYNDLHSNTSLINFHFELISVLGIFITEIIISFIFSWELTLIEIVSIIIKIVLHMLSIKLLNLLNNFNKVKNNERKLNAGIVLTESIINSKTIFAYNFQDKAVEMYLEFYESTLKNPFQKLILEAFFIGLQLFVDFALFATIFKCSYKLTINSKLKYRSMLIVIFSSIMCNFGNSLFYNELLNYIKSKQYYSKIFKILDTKTLEPSYNEKKKNSDSLDIKITGKIEFRNVSFSYPSNPETKILNNISFIIEPEQRIAFVGYSGSGKSTIIQLIERFYDVTEGEILIDGKNIKEFNIVELRKKIAVVQQDIAVFNKNVSDNILYAKLRAFGEKVFNVAKKAKLDNVYDERFNMIRNNKANEERKKRIAMARVLLKNAPIVLIDEGEGNEALEKNVEDEIQKSLEENQIGKTFILATNKIYKVENYDMIFVLEAGEIKERGTHQELKNLGEKYFTMYEYSKEFQL